MKGALYGDAGRGGGVRPRTQRTALDRPLVLDVQGMMRLHDTELVSHGNLRPSNCLVDSRWVLQVADYGLHSLRTVDSSSDIGDDDALHESSLHSTHTRALQIYTTTKTVRLSVTELGVGGWAWSTEKQT